MAHNEILIAASPKAVFAVLANPRSYARWVVGSRAVRRADRDWPSVGSAFDHAVGIGPFVLRDHSQVIECEPQRRLRMLVNARPLSRAFVTLVLAGDGAGTRVSMEEVAADARSRLFFNVVTDPLIRLRNAESLRRLRALAEGDEPIPEGYLPPRESEAEGHVTGASKPASS